MAEGARIYGMRKENIPAGSAGVKRHEITMTNFIPVNLKCKTNA